MSFTPFALAIVKRRKLFSPVAFQMYSRSPRRSLIPNMECKKSFSTVKIVFIEEGNEKIIPVDAKLGEKVVDVAIAHDIDIEAACGGELACSTCHVIVPREYYDKLPAVTDEEQDMLDLAWGLTDR
jgi:ferredoxin